MNQDEAREYLVSLLPPGIEDLWDLEPGGDFYELFDGLGQLLRVYGFNLLDTLRREIFPDQVIDKLSDWEIFLGISKFFIARFGAIAQRQQAVVSKIRERGAFNDATIQSVIAPLLGYFSTTSLEVLRASKTDLRLAHTYSSAALWTIPDATTQMQKVEVLDGGIISKAGARLILELGGAGPYTFTAKLQTPGGAKSKTWTVTTTAGAALQVFYAPELADANITGNWKLTITNASGGNLPIIWSVFVEGIARDQETGGATWHWGVYADPAHVGEAGFSDFQAVRASIERIKHSHGVGRIITSKEPWPGVESGAHAAIPGMCIPSAAV